MGRFLKHFGLRPASNPAARPTLGRPSAGLRSAKALQGPSKKALAERVKYSGARLEKNKKKYGD